MSTTAIRTIRALLAPLLLALAGAALAHPADPTEGGNAPRAVVSGTSTPLRSSCSTSIGIN